METIQLLEENIGRTPFDINYSNISFGSVSQDRNKQTNKQKPTKQNPKINKWDPIKVKNFCTVKETADKMKRQYYK